MKSYCIFSGYDIYDNCDNEYITTDLLFNAEMAGQSMECDPVLNTDSSGFSIGRHVASLIYSLPNLKFSLFFFITRSVKHTSNTKSYIYTYMSGIL